MSVFSKIFKALTFVLAVSTFSFAGVSLADGATKFLGNMIADKQEIPADFETYWNQVSPENACTWTVVEKERGKFDFSGCDRIYDWAQKKDVKFIFRNLLWGTHTPQWLYNLDIDETKKAVENWFDEVAKRYPKLSMIEVMNGGSRDSYGHYHSGFGSGNKIIEALGGDNNDYKFVATAFKMARKRWPNAVLIFNDYDDYGWKNNQGAELIKKNPGTGCTRRCVRNNNSTPRSGIRPCSAMFQHRTNPKRHSGNLRQNKNPFANF